MHEVSRRVLLAAGGVLAGAALLRTSTVTSSDAAEARAAGGMRVPPLDQPARIASLLPTTSGATMQQVERTPEGVFVMTQSLTGSAPGRFTTVITRLRDDGGPGADHVELDAMTIVDGGHGLGLHVDHVDGVDVVWASLQGPVPQSDPDGGRLARFRYTPGVHTIDAIPGGVRYLPRFVNATGGLQEAIYGFDRQRGMVVERMFDFRTGDRERYTRRALSDLVLGIDRPLGRLTLSVNTPTMQGFATAGSTFFRWVGQGNGGSGAGVVSDPMALERWDWRTGARRAVQPFPTLGQTDGVWPDGAYEPEGCSVHRETDGTATLLVGVTVGIAPRHGWSVFAFPDVGDA